VNAKSNSTPFSFHWDRVPPQLPVNASWLQKSGAGTGGGAVG
jgi:hypothetical protein